MKIVPAALATLLFFVAANGAYALGPPILRGNPPPPPISSPPPLGTKVPVSDPTPPPYAPTQPDIYLTVNGEQSIVSGGEPYTLTYASKDVKSCTLMANTVPAQATTYPQANTYASIQRNFFGSYTFNCAGLDGSALSETVAVLHPTLTTQPSPQTEPSPDGTNPQFPVSDYMAALRELMLSGQADNTRSPTDQTQIAPIVPPPLNPTRPTDVTNVIDTIRNDAAVRLSGVNLEAVGRDVRRFEQTVTQQELPNQPATLNPTIARPGITDTPQVEATVEALRERDGIDLYTDTDRDGVSDYDEVHLYGTDPENAHTAGDALTDGERVLRGLDALSKSPGHIRVESPLDAGVESKTIFEVTNIHADTFSVGSTIPVGTTTYSQPQTFKKIIFEGRALPNSFVTLYIFSTPVVVTVKTDQAGNWKYTLDSELADGKHDLYVAMVNNDGRIVAKSPVIPFTKQAEAIEFIPLTAPPVTEPSLIDTLHNNLLVVGALLLLIFGGVAVGFLGLRRPTTEAPAL